MAIQAHGQDINAFYNLLQQHPQGLTQGDLKAAGWNNATRILQFVNELSSRGRLQLIEVGGDIVYQAMNPETAAKLDRLDETSMLVLQRIEQSGNQGVWSKVLKDHTRLPAPTITKITKDLIKRNLIKQVKSMTNRNVFMMKDIEPATEVTGGQWYTDGQFNHSYVESLRDRCMEFLEAEQGTAVTLETVHDHLLSQPGPKAPQADDVQKILRTLELDEQIYAVRTPTGQMVYTHRSVPNFFTGRLPLYLSRKSSKQAAQGAAAQGAGLTVPCLACRLRLECRPGGRICPERCDYIATWLQSDAGQGLLPDGGGGGGAAAGALAW